MTLLPIKQYAKEHHMYTEHAIRNYINKGKWVEGKQYFKPNARIFISPEGVQAWILKESGKRPKAPLRSTSVTTPERAESNG